MEQEYWIKILISAMGLIIAFFGGSWYNRINKVIQKNDETNHRQDTEIALNDQELKTATLRAKESELKLNEGMQTLARDIARYANKNAGDSMRITKLESEHVFISKELRGIRKDMNK